MRRQTTPGRRCAPRGLALARSSGSTAALAEGSARVIRHPTRSRFASRRSIRRPVAGSGSLVGSSSRLRSHLSEPDAPAGPAVERRRVLAELLLERYAHRHPRAGPGRGGITGARLPLRHLRQARDARHLSPGAICPWRRGHRGVHSSRCPRAVERPPAAAPVRDGRRAPHDGARGGRPPAAVRGGPALAEREGLPIDRPSARVARRLRGVRRGPSPSFTSSAVAAA